MGVRKAFRSIKNTLSSFSTSAQTQGRSGGTGSKFFSGAEKVAQSVGVSESSSSQAQGRSSSPTAPTSSRPTTSTPSPPRTSRGGGGGSSSVGGNQLNLTPDQAIAQDNIAIQQRSGGGGITQQQRASLITQQQIQPQQFSGSVAESFKGQPQQTKFFVQGQQTGRTYQDKGQTYAETIKPSTFTFNQGNTQTAVQFNEQGMSSSSVTLQDVAAITQQGTNQMILNEVQPVSRPSGFLEGIRYDYSQGQNYLTTKQSRGTINVPERVLLFGVGFGTGVLDTTLGVKSLVLHPIKTITGIPGALKSEVVQLGVNVKSGVPELTFGRATGFYVGGKGIEYSGKVVVEVSDIVRTKGTIDIPTESIVAPEFFKGQTYPGISKGQTAGQLLQEFKGVPEQYGVTQLKGFTASPSPINPKLGALPGSSEIKGLYQSPKLSPQFLRVTEAEQTGFSFNPLETLRPSASIVRPKSFELAPYLSYSQKNIAPLKSGVSFFSKADLGKSFVPFVKSEKEAVIPAGTPLVLVDKRFSFKFEGRRIPIYEFEVGDITKVSKVDKFYSIADVSKFSSYRVGGKASYTSADILKISRSYSKGSSQSYSKSYSIIPSYSSSVSSIRSSTPSYSKSYGRSSVSSLNSYLSRASYSSSNSRSYGSYGRGSYTGYGGRSYGGVGRGRIEILPPSVSQYKPSYLNKSGFGGVKLFVKEKGQFKFKGLFSDVYKASGAGKYLTGTSINRSYKISGGKAPLLPGYRQSKKKGQQDVFVELSKTALSQPFEQKAVKIGKIMKGGKKRR